MTHNETQANESLAQSVQQRADVVRVLGSKTVTRKMVEQNPEEAHKRCARYHAMIKRELWADDRGNLCRSIYSKGSTLYWFIVLNGELVASGWEPVKI